jgi:hypothetical protein
VKRLLATIALLPNLSLGACTSDVSVAHLDPGPDAGPGSGAGELDWRQVGPEFWPDFDLELREQADLGREGTPTVTSLPIGQVAYGNPWGGGVLAPNGKIYGIPDEAESILEIDPATGSVDAFGVLPQGNDKWRGGVLAFDGKIYAVPREADAMLEIDPEGPSVEVTVPVDGVGVEKWYGAVVAPSGKIYGIPYDEPRVLEFDPATDAVELFGDFPGTTKWRGGVLAPNGKIYAMPFMATSILEIDPDTRDTRLIPTPDGLNNYRGASLGPNGMVYAIPGDASLVLELNPDTDTVRTVGGFDGMPTGYHGGAIAADGSIFGAPFDSDYVYSFLAPERQRPSPGRNPHQRQPVCGLDLGTKRQNLHDSVSRHGGIRNRSPRCGQARPQCLALAVLQQILRSAGERRSLAGSR